MSVFTDAKDKLIFKQSPLSTRSGTTFVIRNDNTTPIAFKIKTTAQRNYRVHPNAGVIEPSSSVTIKVSREEREQGKEKFLVQSVPITNSLDIDHLEFWDDIETNARDTIKKTKLECVVVSTDSSETSQDNTREKDIDQLHQEIQELRQKLQTADAKMVVKKGYPFYVIILAALAAFLAAYFVILNDTTL